MHERAQGTLSHERRVAVLARASHPYLFSHAETVEDPPVRLKLVLSSPQVVKLTSGESKSLNMAAMLVKDGNASFGIVTGIVVRLVKAQGTI